MAHDIPTVISTLSGVQVIVIAMIAGATISFGRRYLKMTQAVCSVTSFVGLLPAVAIRFEPVVPWAPLSMLISDCAFAALWKKVYIVLIGAVVSALLL